MATSELASPPTPLPGRTATRVRAGSRAWANLPLAIGVAVLAAILYAAFAHGAVTRATTTRTELVVAALAAVGALGWLWLGTVRVSTVTATLIGLVLLGGFACWSGLSVLWSISPDQSWIEVNRVVTYLLVVGLGVAVGASHARGVEVVGKGFALAALAVTVYALGQKVLPGLHVSDVFNLNQTGPLPRLHEPLGYWNALALFIAMGTPVALALAVDSSRSAAARLAAACALALMLITVPLTYSRGGLIALAVALAAGLGLSRERLRSLRWLILAVLTAVPAILVGLLVHELSSANVPLGTREWAGGVLAAAVVGGLAGIVLGGRQLLALERRPAISAARASALRRLAWAGLAGIPLAGLVALAVSPRGFTGTLSEAWHGFASTHDTSNYNPQRLLSAASENRWVWWKEAAAAFSARPWKGWGAGSFPILHLLYRRDTLPVQQPHSVPLQFLAETGVIGALLGIGAFVLLTAGGVRAVRRRPAGRERLLAAALLGAALSYGIHCLYDWDWNIPALSLPAFLFLGVVAGRRIQHGPGWTGGGQASSGAASRRGSIRQGMALAGVTLWLSTFALSVELPQLAAEEASSALVAASSPSPAAVRTAQADASLAAQLDPLSDSGLKAEAAVAQRLSRPQTARVYLQEAVSRNPSDPEAWQLLAQLDNALGDKAGAFAALQRAIDLDPMGRVAQTAVANELNRSLPSSSATRFPTPAP
jgi:O-antigen ligase